MLALMNAPNDAPTNAEDQELKELNAKLAELEDELNAREEERDRRARRKAAQDTIESKKRELAELTIIEGLEAKHGEQGKDWNRVDYNGPLVAVKKANHLHYRRFADKGDKIKGDDVIALVATSLIYPTRPEFDTLVVEYPALPYLAGNTIADLARGGAAERRGK